MGWVFGEISRGEFLGWGFVFLRAMYEYFGLNERWLWAMKPDRMVNMHRLG